MPVENSQARILSKGGDASNTAMTVPRTMPVVRQANDTAEDVSAANPMPVGFSGADDTANLTEKVPTALTAVTVATASTAQVLIGTETFATSLFLQAKLVAADNTGSVFIGTSSLDQGSAEMFELRPGDTMAWHARPGTKFDIATFFIDADQGSNVAGVVGMYIPA